jgi:hypothetical protein
MRAVRDSAGLERDERWAAGRLAETDPRWSLRVPGPIRPIEAVAGITLRVVAGSGDSAPPAIVVERPDGTERFDLPAGLVQPPDEGLAAAAWLAALVAGRRRPALVRAEPGLRGYDTMLVALALGDHGAIPVLVDAPEVDTDQPPGSEAAARRRATEERCMRRADVVIADRDDIRAALVERGVPEERVVLIPPAAPADVVAKRTAPILAGRVPPGAA